MKKIISAVCAAVLLLCGCTAEQSESKVQAESTVFEDTKYGAAYVSLSQEEFEECGFTLGDSVDITFAEGESITDVPYYNGYYVKNGSPVLVAYPGFDNISITYNNLGIWESAGLSEGDTVTITLNTKGKYSAIQESLGQVYSFDRNQYTSDVQFCNFRALSGGSLKENFLYRGASPVDNSRGRASYTDGLLEENGIAFVLDLADTEEDMQSYLSGDFHSPYTKSLYEAGNAALLGMGSSYTSDIYKQKLAAGLKQMINSDGPVYIHCMEGKDRTGFVCMLLEALAGADYEEMRADYMITYKNYYSVDPEETPEKYEAITELYFDAFLTCLNGTEDQEELKNASYTEDAAAYLIQGGMSEDEIEQLKAMITK